MEKQIVKKIISLAIIFTFAMFFIQITSPFSAQGATNQGLDWNNPNKNNNPYSLKLNNPLKDPSFYMQVVGCTGVVNKLAKAILWFQHPERYAEKIFEMKDQAIQTMCNSGKFGATIAAATAYGLNFTDAVEKDTFCDQYKLAKDNAAKKALIEIKEGNAEQNVVENCLAGMAITMAKNQLTAMTRYTMNWVNSGFEGNPLYVRDITRFTNSIEKNMLEKEINKFTDRRMAYPYGADFSRSLIGSYKFGALKSGALDMTDSLTSDMTVFLTDTDSYYGSTPDGTSEQERAQRANQMFADDFFTGGWEGWLGLTQRDQNNPMGFTMLASQYIAEEQTYENQNVKDELFQNDGFLSQKKCVKWIVYENGEPKMQLNPNYDPEVDPEYELPQIYEDQFMGVYSPTKTTPEDQCALDGYETVTPGSIIKEKVGYYINSPERQTELADGINDVLNAIFTNMVSNFQNNGLPSLASGTYNYTDPNMGQGLGSTYWTEGTNFVNGTNDSSSSGGYTGQMDLTRDLGNTYLHDYNETSLGNWNANTNVIQPGADNAGGKLYLGLAPKVCDSTGGRNDCTKLVPAHNGYYVVTTAGSTKLFENGFSGWAVGDRAFWNGSEWQNWKCVPGAFGVGCVQNNPIKQRGIIQVQKDYIVAAKEALQILPDVMLKLGELDYCIPGPNPNFNVIYSEAASALSSVVFSLGPEVRDTQFKKITFYANKNGTLDKYNKIVPIDKLWNNMTFQKVAEFASRFSKNGAGYASSGDNFPMQGVDYITNYTSKGIMSFDNSYKKELNSIYGNGEATNYEEATGALKTPDTKDDYGVQYAGMLTEYIKDERGGEDLPPMRNPFYLPMAQDGLNMTKNMATYDEEITNSIQKYKDDIIQANANTAKLMQIKEYVAVIINAAQARRDAKLFAFLNEATIKICDEKYNECISTGTPSGQCFDEAETCRDDVLTMEEYKNKFKVCTDEEKIVYYDDLEIMAGTGVEELRCNDNLDNDMDGLTDMKDLDCSNNICLNGASNPPICTTNNNGSCLNSATNPQDCTGINGVCMNGASNYPDCSENLNNSCENGSSNYPICGVCEEDETTTSNIFNPDTEPCSVEDKENSCNAHIWYHNDTSRTTCKWDTENSGNTPPIEVTQCNDGINNDADTLTDINDPGCHVGNVISGLYVSTDDSEYNAVSGCVNGISIINNNSPQTPSCVSRTTKSVCQGEGLFPAIPYYNSPTTGFFCTWIPY